MKCFNSFMKKARELETINHLDDVRGCIHGTGPKRLAMERVALDFYCRHLGGCTLIETASEEGSESAVAVWLNPHGEVDVVMYIFNLVRGTIMSDILLECRRLVDQWKEKYPEALYIFRTLTPPNRYTYAAMEKV